MIWGTVSKIEIPDSIILIIDKMSTCCSIHRYPSIRFKKYLGPLLKRIHGSSLHLGKSPLKVTKALKKKIDLSSLRYELQKAIEREAFEEAAKIRDQIRELEKKQAQDNNEVK